MANNQDSIALAIYQQIGGHQFIAMTGAHSFTISESELSFSVPRVGNYKVNRVRISLLSSGEYKVEGFNARGFDCVSVGAVEGVQAENLRDVVGRMIGRAVRL